MIRGAMGSLCIAMVPSTVTATFMPSERGTAGGSSRTQQGRELMLKKPHQWQVLWIKYELCTFSILGSVQSHVGWGLEQAGVVQSGTD